ncbi:HAMP domain-containing histidine kinase [Oscillospiraceae bacterium OttesenSCG-928-G22]|nr:HAMP domain-containing histidine kinase [Oscillospiraceae bacterium OttesenSCG-928-G22]
MAITSKRKVALPAFLTGTRAQIALGFSVVLVILVALINTYPVYLSQQFMFQMKRDLLLPRANMLAGTLSGLEAVERVPVERAMAVLGDQGSARVLVVDPNLRVVYDNAISDDASGKLILTNEVRRAFDGLDIFASSFRGDALESKAIVPIVAKGAVAGVVYLYESDAEQAELISAISQNMATISLVIVVITALAIAVISYFLTRRTGVLLEAIRNVREGEYGHRADVPGNDEISQLADEFNELSARLNRVDGIRRQFVSDASHELKTPLASVKILADSIYQTADMPVETMREFAGDIAAEVDRLTRLSEKLLNITRLDAALPDDVYPVDFGACVSRAARMLGPLADREGVRIDCDVPSEIYVDFNDDAAYQIAFNLMENAVKYNRRGGAVYASLVRDGAFVRFVVQDTGVGIPETEFPYVFDRFYRVDKARSRGTGGSGLGLAIVKDTVVQYGGTIRVKSKVGKGTEMTVRFPLSDGGGARG